MTTPVPNHSDAIKPIVVCGAGLLGVATAHHLATRLDVHDVLVVDPLPPLTLTSDKSTECYRNWWPSQPMVQLMSRSIDLLEQFDRESEHALGLNRRGYLFVTADQTQLESMRETGHQAAEWGAGPIREHSDISTYQPHLAHGIQDIDGADILCGPALRQAFPYLGETAIGGVHARRAGWLSAQQLGSWMIDQASAAGVRFLRSKIVGVEVNQEALAAVNLEDGSRIECRSLVNAAGPMQTSIAALAGVELPIYSEVHVKLAFRDVRQAMPRDAPMLIWTDPQHLDWSEGEREGLVQLGRPELTAEMPGHCHGRPEGSAESPWVLALWEYKPTVMAPSWPIPLDELYPEVVMRGMATMIPAFNAYLERLPNPTMDGGYYTRAADNRPIVGPIGPSGFVMAGGVGGFGVMAAAAVGELAALSAAGIPLDPNASPFSPQRFSDPDYDPNPSTDGQL